MPVHRRSPSRIPLALALTLAFTGGCSDDPGPDTEAAADRDPAPPPGAAADTVNAPATAVDRPATVTDTIRIEGMPQEIPLALVSAPDGFPLPFTAYVPADMAVEADPEGTAQFVAEFGGRRSPDAFVHLLVHPDGTDRQVALATARAYKTGRGVPVSQGLEPIAAETRPPHLAWAIEAYRFRYQGESGWYLGTLGVGRHDGRFFQIVRHYPEEYSEGFAPRAELILETWRWADGTRLAAPRPAPPPDRPEPETGPSEASVRP